MNHWTQTHHLMMNLSEPPICPARRPQDFYFEKGLTLAIYPWLQG